MNELAPGTPVLLPDGSLAYAAEDRRIGSPWDGTYRTWQGDRIDTGWTRDQLTVITREDAARRLQLIPCIYGVEVKP